MKLRQALSLMCALALTLCAPALAQEESSPALLRQQVDAPAGTVAYPQLTGLQDAVIQQQANAAILEAGQVETRIARLQSLAADSVGLVQSYEALLAGDMLSVAFSAQGALKDSAFSHAYATVNLDLTTGQPITLADLFTDAAAAQQAIADAIEMQVAPELSAHLEVSSLLPLPDQFALSPVGLTFYYDAARFTTLGGKAGKLTLLYTELREHLKLGEGAVLTRLGAETMLELNSDSAALIRDAVAQGQLPGIPARVGESLSELIARYDLMIDPDYFPGGRFFQLEDGAFRGSFLLTDALTEGWEHSIVQGLRSDRANFYGLCTGITTQDAWRQTLGEPDASVALSEDDAYSYYLATGTSDYYNIGEFQLRLHADEQGVLRSIFITQ